MKESKKASVAIYLLLTIINVVIFAVELNYGTVKEYCGQEVANILEEVNAELQNEENLTDEKVTEIKAEYGISSYGEYVIDSSSMIHDCVTERAWFNLEF